MSELTSHALQVGRKKRLLSIPSKLTFAAGEVWGILGSNGVGKSTLLLTLAGLLPPVAGHILLNHKPLKTYTALARAAHIGILWQENKYFFAQSVYEYCLTSRYPHRYEKTSPIFVDSALEVMGLTHLCQHPVTKLSGGEGRRVAMAALLTQQPDIYLLDEPTNHLDHHYQIHVLQHMQRLAKTGKSIIMACHDVNLVSRFCDKVLLLFANGTQLMGNTKEIITAKNLSALYEQEMVNSKTITHDFWVANIGEKI